MSVVETSVAPPNSIVFVVDPTHVSVVPEDTGVALVTATDSCVAIGTREQASGETRIRLETASGDLEGSVVFQGLLETPGRKVAVETSELDRLVAIDVENASTHIKVWVDDDSEPSSITIQLK